MRYVLCGLSISSCSMISQKKSPDSNPADCKFLTLIRNSPSVIKDYDWSYALHSINHETVTWNILFKAVEVRFAIKHAKFINSFESMLMIFWMQHEDWEVLTEQLMYFIRTDSKPHIYFLPKTHTDETSKRLEQSKKTLQGTQDR